MQRGERGARHKAHLPAGRQETQDSRLRQDSGGQARRKTQEDRVLINDLVDQFSASFVKTPVARGGDTDCSGGKEVQDIRHTCLPAGRRLKT